MWKSNLFLDPGSTPIGSIVIVFICLSFVSECSVVCPWISWRLLIFYFCMKLGHCKSVKAQVLNEKNLFLRTRWRNPISRWFEIFYLCLKNGSFDFMIYLLFGNSLSRNKCKTGYLKILIIEFTSKWTPILKWIIILELFLLVLHKKAKKEWSGFL